MSLALYNRTSQIVRLSSRLRFRQGEEPNIILLVTALPSSLKSPITMTGSPVFSNASSNRWRNAVVSAARIIRERAWPRARSLGSWGLAPSSILGRFDLRWTTKTIASSPAEISNRALSTGREKLWIGIARPSISRCAPAGKSEMISDCKIGNRDTRPTIGPWSALSDTCKVACSYIPVASSTACKAASWKISWKPTMSPSIALSCLATQSTFWSYWSWRYARL